MSVTQVVMSIRALTDSVLFTERLRVRSWGYSTKQMDNPPTLLKLVFAMGGGVCDKVKR